MGIEKERLLHRTKQDKLAELKIIEEMLSMKRTEVQHYDTSDPEREIMEGQLKKLRRRRDRLMELVCNSDDEEADDQQQPRMYTESV